MGQEAISKTKKNKSSDMRKSSEVRVILSAKMKMMLSKLIYLNEFYSLHGALEDEENEDALAAAFEDSDEVEIEIEEDPAAENVSTMKKQNKQGNKGSITDKEFYKAMQKLKDRGTNAVPPKKSASAYIIFGKEVSLFISK